MDVNKNVSVWRGDLIPPTIYHVWIKSDGSQYIYDGEKWVSSFNSGEYTSVLEDGELIPEMIIEESDESINLYTKEQVDELIDSVKKMIKNQELNWNTL